MAALEITRRDARRPALSRLIDYAGLYPPASLGMEAAVAEFRAARQGDSGWMLHRFICPAARLEELVGALTATMSSGEEPWKVSVTTGGAASLGADAGAVRTFVAATGAATTVDLVEIRASDGDLTAQVNESLTAFEAVLAVELPWDGDVEGDLDQLVSVRASSRRTLMAKIRCGGLDAEAFPSSQAVARFLCAAAARDLPVKATAGLHHPFRHTDPDSGFTHHGFVNLLVAASLAHDGADSARVADVLSDGRPESFTIGPAGLAWRDHGVGHDGVALLRSKLFMGYGSCSFDEPVDDLTDLGVLPL